MILKKSSFLILFIFISIFNLNAQQIQYPYPIKDIEIQIDGQVTKMAYMDIKPATPNGHSILLLHGKNFNGFYWKEVIPFFSNAGYRVIVPDQIGWGRSTKPNITYTFELLTHNNKLLLDSLSIEI